MAFGMPRQVERFIYLWSFINHMLKELTMLAPFFSDPSRAYSAREIAAKSGASHVTISKRLKRLPFIKREKYGPYLGFKAEITEEFTRLRWIYNMQKIWDSGLIEKLRSFYDEPDIVLFGSYAAAVNSRDSDIDIAVVSTHKKKLDCSGLEKKIGHKVQLFIYTKKDIEKMKSSQPELLNSICNGIVLSGELEVFV
ncbi:MAG TPA: nucleotidyltransferase domain-containing protein [Candidatus Woesearchaeota archaeon]|nr:nucleotidyltransferase domain-containing protein [Candidatus Woesearchaeota archaeon]